MSTAVHLISPLSKGLFQRAILESDPLSLEIPTYAQFAVRNTAFAQYIGCDAQDIACMRSKSTAEALSASVQTNAAIENIFQFTLEVVLPWRPVLGAPEIPTQILTALSTGNWNQVPVIIGSNNDEGVLFAYQSFAFVDDVEYVGAITAIFKTSAIDVLDVYPTTWNPLKDVRGPISELLTHYLFSCSSRYLSQIISHTNQIWLYHFDRVSPNANLVWGNNYQYCWDKVSRSYQSL